MSTTTLAVTPTLTRPAAHSLRRVLVAAGALALAVAAQRVVQSGRGTDAIVLFVLAILLYLWAIPRARQPLAVGDEPTVRSRWLTGAGVVACMAASGLTSAGAPHFISATPAAEGWTLHLASVGALALAGVLLGIGLRPPNSARVTTWPVALGLIAIVAVGAALRLYHLGTLPFGMWHDEAENALAAQDILRSADFRPFFLSATAHTAHHNYLVAFVFNWLGQSITSARLVSALMGIGMVAATYLAASELFYTDPTHGRARAFVSPAMGLIAAAVIAASSWAINFSRIAVNYIATPLCILLAVGLLLHGLRTQRTNAYLLGGVALGMGLNFYSSFRLFVPVLPLFLLVALIVRRDLWAKSWRGLLLWAFAALVITAPLITFAATNRSVFLKRSQETFIFNNLASKDRVEALLDNTRTHLLMFNVKGDRNGRHNLPGRPMLDPLLGGLFVVGLATCLWRIRRPVYLLLLTWFGFTLLGGILTLPFEAPQSLRANGAVTAAYLIALLPVAEILRAWDRSSGGRYHPKTAPWLAALLVLPVGGWHLNQFFNVQQKDFAVWNAFSTPETLTARALAALDPDSTHAYVVSYFEGRPPLNFIAPQWRGKYSVIESVEPMPLVWPADKDIWLFLDADSRTIYEQLRVMYPNGEFTEQTPPFADTVATRTVHLTRAVLDAAQGLQAHYYANEAWQGTPARSERVATIDADFAQAPPLPAPFSVEYEGVLRVATFGPHTLRLEAPAAAELWVNEHSVISSTTGARATATVTLAAGNHNLRLRAVGAPGLLRLAWAPPDAPAAVMPTQVLFAAPVNANGLLGNYYAGDNWQPPVAWAQITPQIDLIYYNTPLPRPFTVEWRGKLAAPVAGTYLFALNAIDEARLWIDETEVVSTRSGNLLMENATELSQGLHDIRVRYKAVNNHSRVHLEWTPPGGIRIPIPSAALFPPMGDYDRVTLPLFNALLPADFAAQPATNASAAAPGAGDLLTSTLETLLTGLQHPAGIATGPDGRAYVVDSAAATLLVLAPSGGLERTITGGIEPFGEPFDVATDITGTVHVLDAETGTIVLFAPNGDYLRTIEPQTAIGRARGIALDSQGRIWVAHTPGQRLVALDGDGKLVQEIPVWPGADAQVTDIAVSADGSIYAVAMGMNKLVRYDASGARVAAWDVASANTIDSPHLATGASAADPAAAPLYITQPEESRVVVQRADGTRAGYYQLPTPPDMVKPIGVAVAPDNTLWITDVQGGRVLRLLP